MRTYLPIPIYIYQQPPSYPATPAIRASWTPFTWVEKYRYAFSGPFDKPFVALTFDDGPEPVFTPQILDKLKEHGAKGTFFLKGENIEKYPELVKRMVEEGHLVGNHTYSHPDLTKITDEQFQQELQKTSELIQQTAGYLPTYFRPTYGGITESQLKWANDHGMDVIQWSIDTDDWKGLDKDTITETVTFNAMPGSIVLQHNAPGVPLQGSVDALDQIIPQLQAKEARLVTISEMFS